MESLKENIENRTAELYGDIFENLSDEEFYKKSGNYLKRTGLDEKWFRGKICLDAGCGGGFATYALSRIKDTKVFAFDISNRCIKISIKRCKQSKRLLFVQCRIEDIPFKDNVFDFINCNSVLHHLPAHLMVFSELVRLLKPGGFIFIGVYGRGGIMNEVKIKIFRILAKLIPYKMMKVLLPEKIKNDWLANLYDPIRRSFYERDIMEIFKSHHFSNVERLSADFYRRPENFLERLKIGKDGMYMHFLGKK